MSRALAIARAPDGADVNVRLVTHEGRGIRPTRQRSSLWPGSAARPRFGKHGLDAGRESWPIGASRLRADDEKHRAACMGPSVDTALEISECASTSKFGARAEVLAIGASAAAILSECCGQRESEPAVEGSRDSASAALRLRVVLRVCLGSLSERAARAAIMACVPTSRRSSRARSQYAHMPKSELVRPHAR